MTDKQKETVEMLQSEIDDLEVAEDEFSDDEKNPELIFSGYNVDGPTCGYIKTNGEVIWLA